MTIDFSIFQNIDFTNKDQVLFFIISLVVVIIVFSIIIFAIVKIIKILNKEILKVFNIDGKKPKLFHKENTDWLHKPQNNRSTTKLEVPLKSNNNEHQVEKTSVGTSMGAKLDYANIPENNKSKKVTKNAEQKYDEKEQKDISAGLGKLKGISPSTSEEETGIKKISIGSTIEIPTSSELHGDSPVYGKDKTGFAKEISQGPRNKPALNHKTNQDDSIFGGKLEVPKSELENKMGTDYKMWQASEEAGLNLSPLERTKLVKEVFSNDLGSNISKSDLQVSINRLNEKLSSAKSPTEHAKIRKEIKFFKKIGGIKD